MLSWIKRLIIRSVSRVNSSSLVLKTWLLFWLRTERKRRCVTPTPFPYLWTQKLPLKWPLLKMVIIMFSYCGMFVYWLHNLELRTCKESVPMTNHARWWIPITFAFKTRDFIVLILIWIGKKWNSNIIGPHLWPLSPCWTDPGCCCYELGWIIIIVF